jgi:maltose alpha-D-glucosyltransferase/alpha-amylase
MLKSLEAPTEVAASTTHEAQWYKDAIIYQLHVRAFYDSDGDGIGDFAGLTQKLDYLQDLGATAIWLLPFYPSPLKDDGYDIADYRSINPAYGSMRDFTNFLREAHARGLKVITELVINHTSDQHAWFQRARRSPPGSAKRNFYVWSDTPDKYKEARIIFKDFEPSNWSWDPVANAYYWHRFYAHQPDLNFDNPQVRAACIQALDYWLKMGVDGLRLDAIPYLFEREGTNCENLPETHAYLKQLRRHVDEHYANRMLLAEANQWPEDAIAYFGDDDECHTSFHFPLMPRLFMAVHMEDRFPVFEILQQTPPIPPGCQWFLFLRNHDELTLEMVTDEERDYMYRVYALDRQARINLGIRRRLAPLLGNNRRKIELLNGLLLSLPGTPVIYYGDEIGMGDNIFLGDRNGVRTPMQWSSDRNAGFSRANPQKLYLPTIIDFEYHYETVNVETQRNNPHSLWWWMKRLIGIRQLHPAFGRGTFEFLTPENPKVLAYVRSYEDDTILVVANLSRFAQYVELDLSRFQGLRPVELFGQTKFPPIGELPYLLTLGPYTFHWFQLRGQLLEIRTQEAESPSLHAAEDWRDLFHGRARTGLQNLLRKSLLSRRWFGGKARSIQAVHLLDIIPLAASLSQARSVLTLLKVDYFEGESEKYVLPLSFAEGEAAERIRQHSPQAIIAQVQVKTSGASGLLFDASFDPAFGQAAVELIARRRKFKGAGTELVATTTSAFAALRGGQPLDAPATPLGAEQSNSSIQIGEQFVLKLFRKVENGINPDVEVGRFLTEHTEYANAPQVAGAIELRSEHTEPLAVAVLHGYVPNQGTAWKLTLDALKRFYEQVLAEAAELPSTAHGSSSSSLLALAESTPPEIVSTLMGVFLSSAELLGQRTGELHLALASNSDDPAFKPEPFSQLYQRSLYQSLRKLSAQTLQLLSKRAPLAEPAEEEARQVLAREKELMGAFEVVMKQKIHADRIRCHGDYHLGQVLYTGKDFMIIDFEGEPARSLGERRLKRSALVDVAGMIRSFHYAAWAALFKHQQNLGASPDDQHKLREAARSWYRWISAAFLRRYLQTVEGASFKPHALAELEMLLHVLLLEKAIYELKYELNNRPDWVEVPLRGVLELLDARAGG